MNKYKHNIAVNLIFQWINNDDFVVGCPMSSILFMEGLGRACESNLPEWKEEMVQMESKQQDMWHLDHNIFAYCLFYYMHHHSKCNWPFLLIESRQSQFEELKLYKVSPL